MQFFPIFKELERIITFFDRNQEKKEIYSQNSFQFSENWKELERLERKGAYLFPSKREEILINKKAP